MGNRILIVGTYDTKDDELRYIASVIAAQGGQALTMDVSVLGDPKLPTDWTKHDIAAAADTTIPAIIALNDENAAMQAMALRSAPPPPPTPPPPPPPNPPPPPITAQNDETAAMRARALGSARLAARLHHEGR